MIITDFWEEKGNNDAGMERKGERGGYDAVMVLCGNSGVIFMFFYGFH